MSDYHDHHENLAFPPIGSQDDLNEQGRQSEVLIAALEKCEKLEKQLKIAVEALKDSRYLFYQLSQIVAGDGIAECLKEIKELDK